jgi:hypothetical protein
MWKRSGARIVCRKCRKWGRMTQERPSPFGRRWREAPDEGKPAPRYMKSELRLVGADCPHPALSATLSQRERDLTPRNVGSTLVVVVANSL